MNYRIFRRPGPLSLALALLVFSTAATTAEANDAIAPPPREKLHADILQHRVEEARTKARLMERAAQLQRPETANQDQYDATYYNLTLDVNPTAHILSGVVAATARVVTGPISTMDLDLKANMTVSAVTAGGVVSTFSRAGDVLTVNLDRSYAAGESFHGHRDLLRESGGRLLRLEHGLRADDDLDPERAIRRAGLVALQGPKSRQAGLGRRHLHGAGHLPRRLERQARV
jgi:hypothetical protein